MTKHDNRREWSKVTVEHDDGRYLSQHLFKKNYLESNLIANFPLKPVLKLKLTLLVVAFCRWGTEKNHLQLTQTFIPNFHFEISAYCNIPREHFQ